MKKISYILLIQIILLFISCDYECEIISRKYDNGKKRFVDVYPNCNNRNEFKRFIYFENEMLQNEGTFVNNKEHGIFRRWNREGILIEKWEMIRGAESGTVECWHPDGKKKRETSFIDGLENGEFKEWDENGNLIAKGFYKNGMKNNNWTIWRDETRFERRYLNDTLSGKTYEYIVDSSKITHVHGQYEDGVEIGLWKWFNQDSILYQTAVYKNGKMTEIEKIKQ